MDSEKTKRIITNFRKRLRSNDDVEESENKRLKDILEGDIEDFLYLLDTLEPSENKKIHDRLEKFEGILERIENNLSAKIDNLGDELKLKDKRITQLENRVEFLENNIRKKNIRINGLPQEPNESIKDIVVKTLNENLDTNIQSSDIDECFRTGKPDQDNISPTVLVKFKHLEHRSLVFRAKSKLKDSGKKIYYINEDLSKSKADLFKRVKTTTK